jgi:hypothetical protein
MYAAKHNTQLDSVYGRYTGKTGTCKSNDTEGKIVNYYKDVLSYSRDGIKAAMIDGPVSVAINTDNAGFKGYKSGIFNDEGCGSGRNVHHVAIVGYGVDEI